MLMFGLNMTELICYVKIVLNSGRLVGFCLVFDKVSLSSKPRFCSFLLIVISWHHCSPIVSTLCSGCSNADWQLADCCQLPNPIALRRRPASLSIVVHLLNRIVIRFLIVLKPGPPGADCRSVCSHSTLTDNILDHLSCVQLFLQTCPVKPLSFHSHVCGNPPICEAVSYCASIAKKCNCKFH